MERRARVGDVELAYEVLGVGPRLVWFHGLASCRDGDRDMIEVLASRFTVLAYDARGHGRSEPVYEAARYSYPILAEDADRLLGHVGWDGAILAGASMGAATAGRLASITDRARALIMLRPGAGGPDGAAAVWLQLLFAGGASAIRDGGLEGATAFLLSIPAARAELEQHPERLEALRDDWARHDPLSIAAALEGVPRTSPLEDGVTAAMVRCPTLVVPGDDLIHPREAGEALAAAIPGARLHSPLAGLPRRQEVRRFAEIVSAFVAERGVAA